MLNYRLFYVIFILIIYYITTFIISFSFITKSIVNEDPALLKKYIYQETLENNFYNEIYDFNTSYIKKDNEKIIIKAVNQVNKKEIESISDEILSYLKKELNNYSITLRVKLEKLKKENKPKSLNNKEKLKSMIDSNPKFKSLIEEFNLKF